MDNTELFNQIEQESGKPGYIDYLHKSFTDEHNITELLKAELDYIRNRKIINLKLQQIYDLNQLLPKGCFLVKNKYRSYYYNSRTLNRRWNPTETINGSYDSKKYLDLIEGLKKAEEASKRLIC